MPGEIRPARPDEADDVRRVAAAAFGHKPERIIELLDDLEAKHKVTHSLVAEVDGSVVGHVQLNRSWVDARKALVDVLVLSPLSVHPDHQRGGIGTALVASAIDAARDAGAPALFLEGSPSYYGARGFARGADHGFVRPSTRIPEAAFQVVVFDAREEWMTGQLIYCESFWQLDSTGLRDPVLAELEEKFADLS